MSVTANRGRHLGALGFGLAAAATLCAAVWAILAAFTPAPASSRAAAPAAAESATPDSGALAAAAADGSDDGGEPEPESEQKPPGEDAAPLDAKVRKRGVGTLTLKVAPWAEVYEGRRRLGLTPMKPFELPIGRHVLTLKNAQLGVTRQVTAKVTKNAHLTLEVDLAE